MSNLNSAVYTIPLSIYPNYRILNKNVQGKIVKRTIMIPISKEEEDLIDNIGKDILSFTRGNNTFSVQIKDIYCYGEVDFNDEDTLDKIEEFKFLDYLGASGVPIQSNYDYENHVCTSTMRRCQWTESWSPVQVAKIAHGYLGKPKRILLFNQTSKQ